MKCRKNSYEDWLIEAIDRMKNRVDRTDYSDEEAEFYGTPDTTVWRSEDIDKIQKKHRKRVYEI